MRDIALVSYINTRPFMDGLEMLAPEEEISFHLMPPVACAQHLLQGNSQLALIPVGALGNFDSLHLMPHACIGANGRVDSVCIFSQRPLNELHTLILDRHSRSSNGLARILLHHFWDRELEFVMPYQKHFDQIKAGIGGVVIGDAAIRTQSRFRYVYDLSAAWKELTGLPFVFAVWAYHADLMSADLLRRLELALQQGVDQAAKSARRWAEYYQIDPDYAELYLTQRIDYAFDAPKHKALALYQHLLRELPQAQLQAV